MHTTTSFKDQELNQVSQDLKPYALRLTKDESKADDLMQDALVRALKNKKKFTRGTSLKAWLYTIIRNQFFNDYNRDKRRKTFLDTTDNLHYINSAGTKISNQALSNFNLEEINQAIQGLNDLYQEPFMLHYRGFKYKEIASQMNLPIGTVKNRIHVARAKLKKKLSFLKN